MAGVKKARKSTGSDKVYQLKVTLREIEPQIWRRILVPGNVKLSALHHILQLVMGWQDMHLHQFVIGRTPYGPADPENEMEMEDEKQARLDQVVRGEKVRFVYEYDFGDSWEHEILVEKLLAPEPGTHYPVCLAGERACPPEDCGGSSGLSGVDGFQRC
jgi:hypothetical protein